MNYLAHAYLSFGNNEILLGNMISDFVKGKNQYTYPNIVHKGILLHRAIDEFTDTHPITKQAKEVFRPDYRLYSGAFLDVAYDHFLATSKTEFTKNSLLSFTKETYKKLDALHNIMPPAFQKLFYYMQLQNWLYNYQQKSGIFQSFRGLVKRAAYLQDSAAAERVFEKHYLFLKNSFESFWKELKPFAKNKMDTLIAPNT